MLSKMLLLSVTKIFPYLHSFKIHLIFYHLHKDFPNYPVPHWAHIHKNSNSISTSFVLQKQSFNCILILNYNLCGILSFWMNYILPEHRDYVVHDTCNPLLVMFIRWLVIKWNQRSMWVCVNVMTYMLVTASPGDSSYRIPCSSLLTYALGNI